ncbi:D-alanyl-D-alanine carboxypeptidase family protein [Streptomyces sp. NBC_01497]|uniref:D-alanyl-D-alanine carboxypeptidase family protein n=1 Tax=Streptomyces sp. NBC_01497 TaxID=2903885 RepID=UPI002E2FC140|nr:D-alanyl-D-alanine carboxypeptidase [Streptomyces sp. NBC_01497]
MAFAALTVLTALTVLVAVSVPSAPQRHGDPRRGTGQDRAGAAIAAALRSLPGGGQAAVTVIGLGAPATTGAAAPVPIASVAKVMTARVVLADHPLRADGRGPDVTVDRTAAYEAGTADESSVRVDPGQHLAERRLLELMLIPSGNNIARLLARWDAGSEGAFVRKMNAAAAALGMRHTTYTGASGIEATTRSTAADQLVLARRMMDDAVFRSIVSERTVELPRGGGPVANTNTLLGRYGVIGVKTGSSTPAGGALMWAAHLTVDGRDRLLLGVVLHQNAGTDSEEGLSAALNNSRTLLVALRDVLGAGSGTGSRATRGVRTP